MAPRGVAIRGRSIVGLVLVGFVLVASAVVWRRSYGITESRSITDLDRQLAALEADRARLEGAIRDGSGRARIGPIAEQKLGMRVPADTQVVILQRRRQTDDTP